MDILSTVDKEISMQTAMAAALKAKGFEPTRQPSAQESKKPQAQKQPAKKKLQSPTRKTVELKNGAEFVLVFGCSHRFVPEGIQKLPVAGGGGNAATESESGDRFSVVRIDLDGLMSRCIVDKINVCMQKGYCRIYVNCTITAGGEGFKFWHGAYERFIRRGMSGAWKRAVLKLHPDGCTSLELRESCQNDAEVKIGFAIES